MKCLTKHPRLLTYSISAFLFSAFFCAFGMSSDSFALTNSCSPSVSNSGSYYSISYFCPSLYSDFNSSDILYFSVSGSISPTDNNESFIVSSYSNCSVGYNCNKVYDFTDSSLYNSSSGDFFSVSTLFPSGYKYLYFRQYGTSSPSNLVFKVSDNLLDLLPSSGPSEPCPVCPVIPENPYDNKLDDIKKAIYCCGAVLIMLYFFFCIYKIIVKDGGSR